MEESSTLQYYILCKKDQSAGTTVYYLEVTNDTGPDPLTAKKPNVFIPSFYLPELSVAIPRVFIKALKEPLA